MIEKLKALEAAATPRPWEGVKYMDDVHTTTMYLNKEDTYFADTLRNLAPEMIALWEAVEAFRLDFATADEHESMKRLRRAAIALNAKASEMLK